MAHWISCTRRRRPCPRRIFRHSQRKVHGMSEEEKGLPKYVVMPQMPQCFVNRRLRVDDRRSTHAEVADIDLTPIQDDDGVALRSQETSLAESHPFPVLRGLVIGDLSALCGRSVLSAGDNQDQNTQRPGQALRIMTC